LTAIVSVFGLAFTVADIYAVTFGGISPGEHMLGDRAAPSLTGALAIAIFWFGLSFGSIFLRRYALSRFAIFRVMSATIGPNSSFKPTAEVGLGFSDKQPRGGGLIQVLCDCCVLRNMLLWSHDSIIPS
jgi:hypothetical protein